MKLYLTTEEEIGLKMSTAIPAPLLEALLRTQFSQLPCAIDTLSYSCFITGEMEAQRRKVTCPSSHSWEEREPGVKHPSLERQSVCSFHCILPPYTETAF